MAATTSPMKNRTEESNPGQFAARPGERLSDVGGRLEIDCRPGRGFQINAWIPRYAAVS